MSFEFSERVAFLDDCAENFLTTLATVGGYCITEQAQRLGLAQSPTRTRAHLKHLERGGFLRRVADYPVVYQVTKSVARLLGRDFRARRPHPLETVRNRLLAVNFYLEAIHWPAEFVFDHEQKIAALTDYGFTTSALPHHAGKPYLWDEFVLKLSDGKLRVAWIDREHRSPFRQSWTLIKRFLNCLEYGQDNFRLLFVVGREARFHLYHRIIPRQTIQKLARGRFRIVVNLYRVQRRIPLLRSLNRLENSLVSDGDRSFEVEEAELTLPQESMDKAAAFPPASRQPRSSCECGHDWWPSE